MSIDGDDDRKPLPQTRELLLLLLEDLRKVIDVWDEQLCLIRGIIEILRKIPDDLRVFQMSRETLESLGEASLHNNAKVTPMDRVLPFLSEAEMELLFQERDEARQRIEQLEEIESIDDAVRFTDEIELFKEAGERILDELYQLERQIVAELESGADTRADNEKDFLRRLLNDRKVLRLHLAIEREGPSQRTQGEIALEITEGDEKKAASLLRKYRRYKKPLKSSE